MKVRVKLSGAARAVEVGESDQCTLSHLREKTAEVFQLAETSFSLSLNKSDALCGEDQTLSQLGIVPGDLIFVLCPDQDVCNNLNNNAGGKINATSSTSSSSNSSDVNSAQANSTPTQPVSGSASGTECHDMDTDVSEHVAAEQLVAGSCRDMSDEELAVAADNNAHLAVAGLDESNTDGAHPHWDRDSVSPSPLEDPEVNRCLQEPLLCRESLPTAVPAMLRDLFSSAGCATVADALWVVVHALMMEVGFRPLQDGDLMLKEGWNQHGFYKQEYQHLCVNIQHSCALIGVSMGPTLILHGVTSGDPPMKTDSQQLKMADYVQEENISQDVCNVYKNLERLSRTVKDFVCQPLLSQLSEVCGFPVSLGLLSLSYELKLKVLSYLPPSSLVKVGQVCREYNATFKDPCLWRRLYLREFGIKGDSNLNRDWYQLYKGEYLLKKERRKLRHRHHVVTGIPPWLNPPVGNFPPLAPAPYTGGILGGDYDINPEFTSAIPHPLFGRPRGPNSVFGQGPGYPGGPLAPRPRFSDPFGPAAADPFGPSAGPGPPFMTLGGGASRSSRASPFGSFSGKRFM